MSRRWLTLLLAASVTMLASQSPGGEVPTAQYEEIQKAFRWLDTLDFPNIKTSTFVRVATGAMFRYGDKPLESYRVYGFLLADNERQFTFWPFADSPFGLEQRSFSHTTPSESGSQPASFEPREFKNFATEQLGFLRHPEGEGVSEKRMFGDILSQRADVFALAWACRQRGLTNLASDLGRQAYQMDAYYISRENPPTNLVEELQQELGHSAFWHATVKFGRPEVSRSELLGNFQAFLRNYPRSQYASNAVEAVMLLSKMVSEDKEHAEHTRSSLPLDRLPIHERVAELIFQLRDQQCYQFSVPGWCDIFLDPRKEQSPASQLVTIGYDAVPQLIDALDDERFTRSRSSRSVTIQRVGDCAAAILSRIAGGGFDVPPAPNEDKAVTTRKAFLAWWSQLQKKGEKQLWIEIVSSGRRDAMELAPRLLAKFPANATTPICRGIEKAEDSTTGSELIDVLGGTNDDPTTQFLSKQMHVHRLLACRIASANILWKRGVEAALPAMIDEWHRLRDSPEGTETEDLVTFLARSDRPEGIDALTSNWNRRLLDTQETVIESIFEALELSEANRGQTNATSDDDRVMVTNTAALASIERLLIYALSDTKQRLGESGTFYDMSLDDPRICDLAGHTLARFWKGRYVFDDRAFLPERERQRIACINLWRASHNQPLLPLPPQRHVEPADAKTIGPMLQRLRSAQTPADRTAVLAEIEALGLPALAPLVEIQSDSPKAESEWKTAVMASANRLSRRIVETRFKDGSAPPDEPFRIFVEGMKGKSFDSTNFISTLTVFFKQPMTNTVDIELTALRDQNLTGMDLIVELLPRREHVRFTDAWRSYETIEVAGKRVDTSFEGSDDIKSLYEDINKALESPPTASLMVKVRYCRETQIVSPGEEPVDLE